jgi:3-oxoacyl-(acyl-carrier-protein) synthase
MQDVLITGLGVVSPLGSDVASFWNGLLHREVMPTQIDVGLIQPQHMANRLFYSVPESISFSPVPQSSEQDGRSMKFVLSAAIQSVTDADFAPKQLCNAGVVIGTAAGDADLFERARESDDGNLTEPFAFRASSRVAQRLGATGPNLSVSTACSAGAYAIALAADAIRSGWAEVMIAGGCEGLSRVTQACFNRLWVLDKEACRPFDLRRNGTILGEGAAVLVLESAEHARSRGKYNSYARVKGFGWSCDAYNPTAPDPSGAQQESVVLQALKDAQVNCDEVQCIVPHGTGTRLNDTVESEVMRRVFEGRLKKISFSPIKSKLGHGSGAAGAFSCLAASLMVKHDCIPPASRSAQPDPACGVTLHTEGPVFRPVENVLVNAYAFGGNNISVVLGKSV